MTGQKKNAIFGKYGTVPPFVYNIFCFWGRRNVCVCFGLLRVVNYVCCCVCGQLKSTHLINRGFVTNKNAKPRKSGAYSEYFVCVFPECQYPSNLVLICPTRCAATG